MRTRSRPSPPASLCEQVLVPAGTFLFGEDLELTWLPPYSIDRYPVTVGGYASFLEETNHPRPENWPGEERLSRLVTHPVTGVSWFDALAYARWRGRRLPSEAEWEKAARGTDDRLWPWGRQFSVRNLNSRGSHIRRTTPVDRYPNGASPFGVQDLCGNVWEWTDTWFDLDSDLKVLKGGCYALPKNHARISNRHFNDPRFGNNLTGFRTAMTR